MKPLGIKLLTIGDQSVGKTSLLLRFTDDSFSSALINTIGVDYRSRTLELDGTCVKLGIWDTAGQDRFAQMVKSYFKDA
jgi:small GTP-binding protein